MLSGLPGGLALNIACEADDRRVSSRMVHASRCAGLAATAACASHGSTRLRKLTSRFTNVLQRLGIGGGERVFVLAGRIPELYLAVPGTLKNRSVACPLFSAFGP